MDRPPLPIRLIESLREFGARIIDVREWCAERWDLWFGRSVDFVLDAFDSFESLESATIRIVGVLLWPFAAIARLLRVPALFRWVIELPGNTAWWLYQAMAWSAERLHLGGAFARFSDFVYWLFTPVRAFGFFLYAWCVTRKPRDLALATPAILMLLPFVYVAIAGASRSSGVVAGRYRDAVKEYELAGDQETADLMRRKLEQLGVSTSRSDFIDALNLADRGDLDEARAKMEQLAPLDNPDDAPGYAPAHRWWVQHLLADKTQDGDMPLDRGARLALAAQHLERIRAAEGDSEPLAATQAYLLAEQGDIKQALAAITPYAEESLKASSMRLRLLVMDKQQAAAVGQAQAFLARFDASPPDPVSADDHRSRALAGRLLGRRLTVEESLVELTRLDPDAADARQQLAVISLQLAQQSLTSQSLDGGLLAERVIRAERMGASADAVGQTLQAIVIQRRGSEACRAAWNQMLASPDSTVTLLEIAGSLAASTGEITQARKAFWQVTESGDAPAVVWNNLAWTLLQEPLPQPTEALKAVNKALAKHPQDPHFRETRGQALLRLKQWRDAIADLEFALNAMPDSRDAHSGLATAYEAIGDLQLADVHRRLLGE
ncbi:hypothetical protein Pla123a_10960 [Posidoniimonas polymericola]|uniref:Uncharacterized protein n=1 Tax=Posidoniimonas polymericola TaxID=2528002 RepID=A0A5C5YTK2_9BACT|nr:hypothetical protein [Posidoniimonas polymericola]TWT78305.1 hypothetical protein Pla123a_10960 [Posidoniimonas polymericola]